MKKLQSLSKNLLPIITISVSWLITALILLVYSFGYLDEINAPIIGAIDVKSLLLISVTAFAIISIWITGVIIDRNISRINSLLVISLVAAASCLTILGLSDIFVYNRIVVSITFIGLGSALGIITGVAGVYFGGLTHKNNRGQVYSIGIFIFTGLAVVIIFLQTLLGRLEQRSFSFLFLGIIVILVLFLSLFLFRRTPLWKNDEFPTATRRIFERTTLRYYLLSHFLVYFMLGLAINLISESGRAITTWIVWQQVFDPVDIFWIIVFAADFLFILFAGYIVDKYGIRKLGTIIAIYGIAVSFLIFDIERSTLTYIASAFILGASISFIHVTIDSAVWADLSPRDALGRYFALGYISLILGISLGYSLGIGLGISGVNIGGVLLIFLAALSIFPLVFVSDSYEPLDFVLLLVIVRGGLPCFYYDFGKKQEKQVDMALLAGALDAIGNFMGEVMIGKGQLNAVHHGSYYILTESHQNIKGALITNKGDREVRNQLKKFLETFYRQFETHLDPWLGDLEIFSDAIAIVENQFGPYIPSSDLL